MCRCEIFCRTYDASFFPKNLLEHRGEKPLNKKKVAKDNDKSFLHLLQIVIYLILVVQFFLHLCFSFDILLEITWDVSASQTARVVYLCVTIHYISLFYHTNCVPFSSLGWY